MNLLQKLKTIFLPLLGGILISFIIGPTIDSYEKLNQPLFSPPGYIFPIAWTILYLLMGISNYLSLKEEAPNSKKASAIFYLSLVINYLWPLLFFTFHQPILALVCILFLIYTVILWLKQLINITKKGFILQIPYLLWLTFATYLNLAIIILN